MIRSAISARFATRTFRIIARGHSAQMPGCHRFTTDGSVRRVWTSRSSVLAALVCGVTLTACEGRERSATPRPTPRSDSGVFRNVDASALDSGTSANADAAGGTDAGPGGDAAAMPDAGPGADSGHPADGGPSAVDAGHTMDATTTDGGHTTTTDAGPVMDAGAPSCMFGGITAPSRLDPRARIPATRLDDLEACVQARPSDAAALVTAFLGEVATAGWGAPLWRNGNALVLYRGDASNLSVSGSFDSWPAPGIRGFRNISGTDLHVAEVPLPEGGRAQYKLTRNNGGSIDWFTDPLNPWVIWDGIPVNGLGDFNNELAGPTHAITTSFLHRRVVQARDVFVQLPVAYFNGGTGFGTLYVHDGNESLARANMQAVTDTTIAAGRADPLVVVYVALVDQNQRIAEYTYGPGTTGDAYVDLLADTIVPLVEANVPTASMPENRGLAGASLGGLISFHGAWRRPDAFRLIGGQSSSLWFDSQEMVTRFSTNPAMDFRIYLDSGTDNFDSTEAMAAVLTARGYDHLYVVDSNAAHEWRFWEDRWDELLEFLY